MKYISFSRIKIDLLTAFDRLFLNDMLYYVKGSVKYPFDEVFHIEKAENILQISGLVCDDSLLRIAQNRFDLGHKLFYCCDNKIVIAYGWLTNEVTSYYAWEIANYIKFDQSVAILYDSYVNPKYRRRGIQKSLIHARINDAPINTPLVVYAESSNIPSIKAITHCGFKYAGKLTHFSNKVRFV